jgi:hypothetical protein
MLSLQPHLTGAGPGVVRPGAADVNPRAAVPVRYEIVVAGDGAPRPRTGGRFTQLKSNRNAAWCAALVRRL